MVAMGPVQLSALALLLLAAGAAGLSYRRAQLQVSETEIIERYAAQYLTDNPSGALTDCRAQAGQGLGERMIVICGPAPFDATRHYEYHVGPFGGLIKQYGPGDWLTRNPVAGRERI